jgi:hypothetical protein
MAMTKLDCPNGRPSGCPAAQLPDCPTVQIGQPDRLPREEPEVTDFESLGEDLDEQFHDAPAEFELEDPDAIDWDSDPLMAGSSAEGPTTWTHSFFAQKVPRMSREVTDDETLRKQMRELLTEIELGPPLVDSEEKEEMLTEWLRSVEDNLHPVEEFVAGSFGRHKAAWEELLSQTNRPASKSVLSWIRSGIKPTFAGTSECDPKKLERVRRMLKRVVGEARVDEWLSGQVPHPVEFPNHRSFFENAEFGVQAVGEMLVNSTVKLYGEGERRPKVVNPLGVANLPKGRLVLDGGYVNAFTKHVPFKYETLREILTFLSEHGFLSTWDFKAGYYHVLIHPRFRTYFGFKIGRSYFHYNAMCFGWSEACLAYTLVTQEAAKELRLRGIPLSSYLDDGLTGDKLYLVALWRIVMIIRFLTLLGAVFSYPKCRFWPAKKGDWLGFVVDTTSQQFQVSESKMSKVQAVLEELATAETVTPRLLARVAGKVIAMGPAVLPASLYSRPFFQAIQGKLSWDVVFPNPEEARKTARLFIENLSDWNGRRWYPRRVLLEVASDASDFGIGGTIKVVGRPPFELAGSLSEKEVAMSSTAREMLGFLRILQQAAARSPELIRDSAILVIGDNQGAVAALNKFSSPAPDVAASLREIFAICSTLDFDVVAQWSPRDELAAEDALSRVPDASDWGLAPRALALIVSTFGAPSVDLFASNLWHVCPTFVSARHMPGCAVADALNLDWRALVPAGTTAYIFPPVRAIPKAIQLLKEFQIDAVLVVPEAPTTNWWLELQGLRAGARIDGPIILARSTDVCIPSRRVPPGTVNPALFKLRVFKITWSR